MKKQKKNSICKNSVNNNNIMNKKLQNGITLIALVISIIVMLILAGVSINAIVGDNGILSRTQYATFINEMTAVEEAVQMWKAGEIIDNNGNETTAIPTNGMCKPNDISNTERLTGEIGFYRAWSINKVMPETSILTPAESFNSTFGAELISYPAGVQDLYYLNNEACGIDSKKTYLIDAATGIVYSMTGIALKGVSCYSLNMAKAVMNGDMTAPQFAAAEVSGSGSGIVNAGNTEPEFLPDGKKNPNYNPYGFQIIADATNDNVYKLYNNGDLYGKGVKGKLLNNEPEELEELAIHKWKTFSIPDEIPGDDTNRIISPGYDNMFIIDENKELWAWGDNSYNKLGLTQEEQKEYITVKPTKLNINGNKVKKVFPMLNNTFVLTEGNELYAAGNNINGQLGIGHISSNEEKFVKVNFENPSSILTISNNSAYQKGICILTKNGSDTQIYYAGISNNSKYTETINNNVCTFNRIYDGNKGELISNEIVTLTFIDDGKGYILDNKGLLYSINPSTLSLFKVNVGDTTGDIETIRSLPSAIIAIKKVNENRQLYFYDYDFNWGPHHLLDLDIQAGTTKFVQFNENITKNLDLNQIKDIFIMSNHEIYILMNDGRVYAKGTNQDFGAGISLGNTINEFRCIQDYTEDLPLINSFCVAKDSTLFSDFSYGLLKGKDGIYYAIGNQDLIIRDKKFQKSWKHIASEVKKFNASTSSNSLAYIDKNDDIWVLGESASMLGCNTNGEDYQIPNFVRLKDKLEGLEVYEHISGKVEDYAIIRNAFYIKTNSSDDNSLYVSGFYKDGTRIACIGIESDSYIPTKILSNIENYCINQFCRTCRNNKRK